MIDDTVVHVQSKASTNHDFSCEAIHIRFYYTVPSAPVPVVQCPLQYSLYDRHRTHNAIQRAVTVEQPYLVQLLYYWQNYNLLPEYR